MGAASSAYRTSERTVPRHLPPNAARVGTGQQPNRVAGGPGISVIPVPRNASPTAPAGGHARDHARGRLVPAPATPGVRVLADPENGWRTGPAELPVVRTDEPGGAVLPRRLKRGPDRLGSHRAPRSTLRRCFGIVLVLGVLVVPVVLTVLTVALVAAGAVAGGS